mmetsp:Transcript_83589/g.236644  ORF Transcript_83589/g.236644 Transcript_83589/m.236644 type:complete len:250 (+) Transcript_83589:2099-2848(+)
MDTDGHRTIHGEIVNSFGGPFHSDQLWGSHPLHGQPAPLGLPCHDHHPGNDGPVLLPDLDCRHGVRADPDHRPDDFRGPQRGLYPAHVPRLPRVCPRHRSGEGDGRSDARGPSHPGWRPDDGRGDRVLVSLLDTALLPARCHALSQHPDHPGPDVLLPDSAADGRGAPRGVLRHLRGALLPRGPEGPAVARRGRRGLGLRAIDAYLAATDPRGGRPRHPGHRRGGGGGGEPRAAAGRPGGAARGDCAQA